MRARTWITPLTIGSFLLVGVTGLLLLLKIRTGLISFAHEWLSLIFVVSSALHIWLNWKAVRNYLARTSGRVLVGVFTILLALVVIPWPFPGAKGMASGDTSRQATRLLLNARVSTLAELVGCPLSQMRGALITKGIQVVSDDTTLIQAARQSHSNPMAALAAALQVCRGQ